MLQQNVANHPPRPDTDYEAFDELYNKLTALESGLSNLGKPPLEPIVDPETLIDLVGVAPNSTSVVLTNSLSFPAMITSIIASIPAAATGTLQIGKRLIPLTGGIQGGLNTLQMIVYPADVIQIINVSASGNVFLELMGGLLRGDRWRVLP